MGPLEARTKTAKIEADIMYWEGIAALEAGVIDIWFKLDPYTRAFIVALVETKRDLEAMMAEEVEFNAD